MQELLNKVEEQSRIIEELAQRVYRLEEMINRVFPEDTKLGDLVIAILSKMELNEYFEFCRENHLDPKALSGLLKSE